jgi:hypothetical protein
MRVAVDVSEELVTTVSQRSTRKVDLTTWPRVNTGETSPFDPSNQITTRRLVPWDCLLDQQFCDKTLNLFFLFYWFDYDLLQTKIKRYNIMHTTGGRSYYQYFLLEVSRNISIRPQFCLVQFTRNYSGFVTSQECYPARSEHRYLSFAAS